MEREEKALKRVLEGFFAQCVQVSKEESKVCIEFTDNETDQRYKVTIERI